MAKKAYVVVFDELKNEKGDGDKGDGDKPPSYYLFNEILENSTVIIPVICSISDKCPDHVIMVVPLSLTERVEKIIPSYWESYIYWQYITTNVSIDPAGLVKIVNGMFRWFIQMKKMPYIVITGFKSGCSGHLSRIDIISCLFHNGLPEDRLFFIDDGKCERDVCIIKDLVKIVERNTSFMNN